MLAPPMEGWHPHHGEILDPPLGRVPPLRKSWIRHRQHFLNEKYSIHNDQKSKYNSPLLLKQRSYYHMISRHIFSLSQIYEEAVLLNAIITR